MSSSHREGDRSPRFRLPGTRRKTASGAALSPRGDASPRDVAQKTPRGGAVDASELAAQIASLEPAAKLKVLAMKRVVAREAVAAARRACAARDDAGKQARAARRAALSEALRDEREVVALHEAALLAHAGPDGVATALAEAEAELAAAKKAHVGLERLVGFYKADPVASAAAQQDVAESARRVAAAEQHVAELEARLAAAGDPLKTMEARLADLRAQLAKEQKTHDGLRRVAALMEMDQGSQQKDTEGRVAQSEALMKTLRADIEALEAELAAARQAAAAAAEAAAPATRTPADIEAEIARAAEAQDFARAIELREELKAAKAAAADAEAAAPAAAAAGRTKEQVEADIAAAVAAQDFARAIELRDELQALAATAEAAAPPEPVAVSVRLMSLEARELSVTLPDSKPLASRSLAEARTLLAVAADRASVELFVERPNSDLVKLRTDQDWKFAAKTGKFVVL